MNVFISRAGLSLALALSVLVSFLHSHPTQAQGQGDPCQPSAVLDAGEGWLSSSGESSEEFHITINIPGPGWLAFEASAPGSASSGAAWTELLSPNCDESSFGVSVPARFLRQGLVRASEAGALSMRLGAVGPTTFGESRVLTLNTHFFPVSAKPFRRIFGGDGGPGDDTEEEDGEILPLIFPWEPCPVLASSQSSGALQGLSGADGGPGDDTEEEDGEILPLSSPWEPCLELPLNHPPGTFGVLAGGDGGPGDDTEEEDGEILPIYAPGPGLDAAACEGEPANGFNACAMDWVVETEITGALDSGVGFDRDIYTFTVESLREIRWQVLGEGDLLLILTDHLGREILTRSVSGGARGNPFATTLIPGRYFLRIEGFTAGDISYRIQTTDALRR